MAGWKRARPCSTPVIQNPCMYGKTTRQGWHAFRVQCGAASTGQPFNNTAQPHACSGIVVHAVQM